MDQGPGSGITNQSLSKKHPDPPELHGSGQPEEVKSQLRTFTAQLRIKLALNADWYPTEQSRLSYAASRLQHPASSQYLPFVKTNGHIDIAGGVEGLIKKLEVAYGDPDRLRSATQKFNDLVQGNKPFSTFIATFQNLAAELSFNEVSLINYLDIKKSRDLSRLMIGRKVPNTLASYIQLLQELDNDQRYFNEKHPRTNTTHKPFSNNQPASTITNSSITTAHPASPPTNTGTKPLTTTQGGDAMDTSAARIRGPLSETERARRLNNGLCLYCGTHTFERGVQCPLKRRPRPQQVHEATLTTDDDPLPTGQGNSQSLN